MLLTREQLKEKGLSKKSLKYYDSSGVKIYGTYGFDVYYGGKIIFITATIEELNKVMEFVQDVVVINELKDKEEENPLVIDSYYLDQFAEGYPQFLKWAKKGFMDYDEEHGVFLQSKYFLATFEDYRTEDASCGNQRLSVNRNGVQFFCYVTEEKEE